MTNYTRVSISRCYAGGETFFRFRFSRREIFRATYLRRFIDRTVLGMYIIFIYECIRVYDKIR